MVVHAALGEQGDILEALVVPDNMIKVGMAFTADVVKNLNIEAKFGRVLGTAFGVDLAVFDDRFEPGKVFAVMRDDNLKVRRVKSRG